MNHRKGTFRRLYWLLAGLLTWFALALQLYLIVAKNIEDNTSVVLGIIKYISYFTILSNAFVALAFTLPLLAPLSQLGMFLSRSPVRTAIAAYIIVTGTVYVLILRNIWDPQGLQWVADVLLHYATPLLYVVSWLLLEHRGTLRWTQIFPWLVFPLGYFGYTLIRGALSGIYPYPFIDVGELGLAQVLLNALGLTVAFGMLGLLMVGGDRLLGRWSNRSPKRWNRLGDRL